MQAKRIAVLTYHKYPGDDWPMEEFLERGVELAEETLAMKLAERGSALKQRVVGPRNTQVVGRRETDGRSTPITRPTTPVWRHRCLPVVAGKLLSLHAGTLRPRPVGGVWTRIDS